MIVFDTSSLSALAKIQRLDLLRVFTEEIVIPVEVYNELSRSDVVHGVDWSLIKVIQLNKNEIDDCGNLQRRFNINRGEAEVIALAKSRDCGAVIDERLAVSVACDEGVLHTGTLKHHTYGLQK